MESQVYIVGPLELQNEALSSFLQNETGLTCTSCQGIDLTSILGKKNEPRSLVLWDCLEIDPGSLWTTLCADSNLNLAECCVALFNVNVDMGIEKEAARRGIRGILYKHASLEIFAKGVKSIIGGKLWFSRDTMTEFLLNSRGNPEPVEQIQISLSPREREILALVASGTKNVEIAEQLGVSLRTIKSHLYNIYRKIGVPNRLQAALWAIRNL